MTTKVIVKTTLAGELRYIIWDGQYYPADKVEVIEQLPVKTIGAVNDEQTKRSKG